jgi:cell division protein ZapA (FtsZ GTPase activity inhibitor)
VKKVCTLRIFDEEISVKTDADEEQLQRLTAYLQEKFEQIKSTAPNTSRSHQMALAILAVATDYFDMRELVEDLKARVEEMSTKMIVRIESISPLEASKVN